MSRRPERVRVAGRPPESTPRWIPIGHTWSSSTGSLGRRWSWRVMRVIPSFGDSGPAHEGEVGAPTLGSRSPRLAARCSGGRRRVQVVPAGGAARAGAARVQAGGGEGDEAVKARAKFSEAQGE